jgi:site-specific recombinase XerD
MDTHHPAHVPVQSPTHVVGHVPPPVLPSDLTDKVSALREASKAENTRRAYLSDWRSWSAWCHSHGVAPLPAHPDTVSAYLADKAGTVKVSTLRRHLATVSKAHQVAGFPNPCRETLVRDTVSGLRRTHGTATDEAPGLMGDQLGQTLDTLGDSAADLRDRALLLTGWCAGLRRSELAALTWADLTADPDGLVLTLRRSKTDQEGAGRQVGIARQDNPARCPVMALEQWREASNPTDPERPVFVEVTRWGTLKTAHLTGQAVALVVQRRTKKAGLVTHYRGHSLRKGLVQTAHLAGVSDSAVMATTGHQSVSMLRRYQGQAGLVSRSASKGLLT